MYEDLNSYTTFYFSYDYLYNRKDITMIDFIKLITTIMGVAFPAFLIKAIKAQNDDTTSKYTIWACVSFGIVVLTLMALH